MPQSHRNTAANTNKAHSVTTRNSGVHTRTNTVDINTAKERFHNARQGLRTRDSTFQRPIAGRNRIMGMNNTEGKLSNDKVA